jgi:ribosomal protein L12E/L44/L45/RPP1/RPP2
MARVLGVECKKDKVYLAVVQDGQVQDEEPQRLKVPAIHEEGARLQGFLDDFGRLVAETKPDAVHIIQPETIYSATYSELAPKAALETLIRLACLKAGVPVEIIHRATARSALGGGNLDELIAAATDPVGKYWGVGRKYAAAAALTKPKRKKK